MELDRRGRRWRLAAAALVAQPPSAATGGPFCNLRRPGLARTLVRASASARCCCWLRVGRLRPSGTSEYVGSLLLTIAGLMLVAGAGDLVLLFVGLELISIPTYVLLYLGRRDAPMPGIDGQVFLL